MQKANYKWNGCVVLDFLNLLHHTTVEIKGISADAVVLAAHTES